MKRRFHVILITCAVLLLLAVLTLCFPGSRKIDTTLIATEYRFNDPDYAVEHTITIRGYDTRNLLGRGTFEGTFAVSDWETAQEGWSAYIQFPIRSDSYFNMNFNDPSGQAITRNTFSMLADRDWTRFVGLILESTEHNDGTVTGSFDPETGRFLVSGPPDRTVALTLASELAKGTSLEALFPR